MNECSRRQAENMAGHVGICLDKGQIEAYISERDKMPTGNKEDGIPPSCRLSDQELFNSVLDKQQSVSFREKYPNIFHEKI